MDVFIAEPTQQAFGGSRQTRNDLDRVNVADQRAEDRRLITAPRSDLQNLIRRLGREDLVINATIKRTADRLRFADRQRSIEIGLIA